MEGRSCVDRRTAGPSRDPQGSAVLDDLAARGADGTGGESTGPIESAAVPLGLAMAAAAPARVAPPVKGEAMIEPTAMVSEAAAPSPPIAAPMPARLMPRLTASNISSLIYARPDRASSTAPDFA